MMTYDEIRDRINARLRDGTGQAKDNDGYCVYRDSSGRACAVGCLIPDAAYDPLAEGATTVKLGINDGAWIPIVSEPSSASRRALAAMLTAAGIPATPEVHNLLGRAQAYHDNDSYWDGDRYVGPTLY